MPTHDTFFSVQIKQKKQTVLTQSITASLGYVYVICIAIETWLQIICKPPGSMLNQKEIHGKHKIILRQLVT